MGFGDESNLTIGETDLQFGSMCVNPSNDDLLRMIVLPNQDELKPVSMYKDAVLALCFPSIFQHGYTGSRKGVSLKNYVRIIASRADKRTERHYTFLFILFSLVTKLDVFTSTAYVATDNEVFEALNPLERETFASLAANNFIAPKDLDYGKVTPNVKKALDVLKKHTKCLPKSRGQMDRHRRQVFTGLQPLFGDPGLFLTLNCNFTDNVLVFQFDEFREEVDLRNLSRPERLAILSDHPATCVRFFHWLIDVVFKEMLAIDNDDVDRGCLGEVLCYIASFEVNQR